MTLRKEDLEILEKKGITPEKFERQLKMLRTGFPCLRLKGAATVGDGITRVTPELEKTAVGIWDDYAARGGKVVKMVPASGAASRMFKNVFAFLNGKDSKPQDDFMKTFFARITEFAFFDALNAAAMADGGKSILSLIADGEYKKVASLLLETPGLGYGKLPKALLRFHKVPGASRTPLEEHLAEGAQYAADRKGNVAVHFTVSEEHKEPALRKVEEVKRLM